MIKEKLTNSLFYNGIKRDLALFNTSPELNGYYIDASTIIDKIMSLDPNQVGYQDIISSTVYNDYISSIISLFSSLDDISQGFTSDYVLLSKKYISMYEKMKNSLSFYRKKIDILTDRLCLEIDHGYKNERLESKCGHFGNYLTLPYFINTAGMYQDGVTFSIVSDAQVQYSNLSNITSLPFTDKPAFKLLSQSNEISTNIKVRIGQAKYNAIYLNIPSDKIISLIVNINTPNGKITKEFDSGEIFFSFDKAEFSTIEFVIRSNNYNPGKPYSMAISDLMIFSNIEFMNYGVFKSRAIDFEKIRNIDSITMLNSGDIQPETNITQSLSISNDEKILTYNRVDSDKYLDMSTYYLNKSANIVLETGEMSLLTLDYNGNNYDFYKMYISSASSLWDMQYTKANIITGINTDFMDQTSDDTRYENWTPVDNYYVTNIANFSDNININIGSKNFILNGKDVTGIVTIPFGMSEIKVLEKDIKFINVTDGDAVKSDILYLNNFAYIFTGMPEFAVDNTPVVKTKAFNINSQSVLYMNETFVSSGVSVSDDRGNQYRMHMSKNVSTEGTFTIEPSKGIVKVFPMSNATTVTVRYFKASQIIPPVGILFADLLTFAPLTSLLDPSVGSSIFSIDGKDTERILYIPKAPRGPGASNYTSHTQILYNKIDEPIYLSAMLEMQTSNKYISPAVKSLTLSIK